MYGAAPFPRLRFPLLDDSVSQGDLRALGSLPSTRHGYHSPGGLADAQVLLVGPDRDARWQLPGPLHQLQDRRPVHVQVLDEAGEARLDQ